MTIDPRLRTDGFAPIGSYALLGDGRTVALVATDGSVDWLPLPSMDGPPAFERLLDGEGGGRFELEPDAEYRARRRYREDTAVLETTFETDSGTVTIVDALNRDGNGPLPWIELARVVETEGGEVPMRWRVAPGRRFGHAEPWTTRADGVPCIRLGDQTMAVVATGAGEPRLSPHVVDGMFTAVPGRPSLVALVATDGEPVPVPSAERIIERVQRTTDGWRSWRRQVRYDGPAADAVLRSALTLRLLTYTDRGANIAAATTSLPEVVGGDRNFDYRFCWVRDASFAIDSLAGLDLTAEVHSSLSWLLQAVARTAPDVHVFYTLDGAPASSNMEEIPVVAGYLHSLPVHVGNSAADQRQLGAYGHVMDAAWRYVRHGGRLDPATGSLFAELANQVCDLWRLPDAGLWELGQYEQYASSKVGCWVALDRSVWFADHGQLCGDPDRWRATRDEIRSWIDEHCWSATKRSYTMHAGSDDLDAAVLLMARTGFCPPGDERLSSTVDAIREELCATGPLLFRYSAMKGKEGAFAACSFWLVEALVRCRRQDEARSLFEAMLDYSNDVGLLSEEIDPSSGELLGNFPQGLSHLALVGAATSLAAGG